MNWKNHVKSGKDSIQNRQKQTEALKEKIKLKNIFLFNQDVVLDIKRNIEYYIEGKGYSTLVRSVTNPKYLKQHILEIHMHKDGVSYWVQIAFPKCSLTNEKLSNGIYNYKDGLYFNYKVWRQQQTLFSKLHGFLTHTSGFSSTILSKSQNEKAIDLKDKQKDDISNEILPLVIDVLESTIHSYHLL